MEVHQCTVKEYRSYKPWLLFKINKASIIPLIFPKDINTIQVKSLTKSFMSTQGLQEGSVDKDACYQAWWSKFDPWPTRLKVRTVFWTLSPDLHIHMPGHVSTHTETNIYEHQIHEQNIRKTYLKFLKWRFLYCLFVCFKNF